MSQQFDVEAVAKRLTKAQREALCLLTAEPRYFRPAFTGVRWPTMAVLKSKRLVLARLAGIEGAGHRAVHYLSDTGLALRAHLLSTAKKDDGDGE